jgi:hypothetical protein
VNAEKAAGRNIISFALKNTTASNPTTSFASKEALANPPQLRLTTAGTAKAGFEQKGSVEETASVQVSPNPAREEVQVAFSVKKEQTVRLSLHNAVSQSGFTISKQATPGFNRVGISVGNLKEGLYFLTLYKDGCKIVKKVVITN